MQAVSDIWCKMSWMEARVDVHVKNTCVLNMWDKKDFKHNGCKGKQGKGNFFVLQDCVMEQEEWENVQVHK